MVSIIDVIVWRCTAVAGSENEKRYSGLESWIEIKFLHSLHICSIWYVTYDMHWFHNRSQMNSNNHVHRGPILYRNRFCGEFSTWHSVNVTYWRFSMLGIWTKMNFTVNLSQLKINTLDQNMHLGSYYPRLTIALSM